MDLKTQTIEQLKSLAYDQIRELQRIQQNIALIEQELAEREKQTSLTKEDTKKKEG